MVAGTPTAVIEEARAGAVLDQAWLIVSWDLIEVVLPSVALPLSGQPCPWVTQKQDPDGRQGPSPRLTRGRWVRGPRGRSSDSSPRFSQERTSRPTAPCPRAAAGENQPAKPVERFSGSPLVQRARPWPMSKTVPAAPAGPPGADRAVAPDACRANARRTIDNVESRHQRPAGRYSSASGTTPPSGFLPILAKPLTRRLPAKHSVSSYAPGKLKPK